MDDAHAERRFYAMAPCSAKPQYQAAPPLSGPRLAPADGVGNNRKRFRKQAIP
jgi:hypothetical protein